MIGFVILSHNNPKQLKRLIDKINVLYDYPPIACHHDFSQSILDTETYGKNVWFVHNHVRTGWGRWSLVVGFLRALRLLYSRSSPEWFTLLSAADYPIKSASDVWSFLESAEADALLDIRPVLGESVPRHIGDFDPNLRHHDNMEIAKKRYIHSRIYFSDHLLRSKFDTEEDREDCIYNNYKTYRLPFKSLMSPFRRNFICYVGSQWFTGRKSVAHLLLNPTNSHINIRKYFSIRWVPDESYVQTIIGNEESFTIWRNPCRFTRWNLTDAHPHIFGDDDLDAIKASSGHFARKFEADSAILDKIDICLD